MKAYLLNKSPDKTSFVSPPYLLPIGPGLPALIPSLIKSTRATVAFLPCLSATVPAIMEHLSSIKVTTCHQSGD
jgi:hypothetical protein